MGQVPPNLEPWYRRSRRQGPTTKKTFYRDCDNFAENQGSQCDDRRQAVTAHRIVGDISALTLPMELLKPRGMETNHE